MKTSVLSLLLMLSFVLVGAAQETTPVYTVSSIQDGSKSTPIADMLESVMEKTPAGFEMSSWIAVGNGGLLENINPADRVVGVNQLGLSLQKSGETFSAQVDFLYGRDAAQFQSFMNGSTSWDNTASFDHGAYAIAMPQLFVEADVNDWTIRGGHFLFNSTSGLYSTDRFFATRTAAESILVRPYTLSGITATTQMEETELTLGWAAGVNTGFDSSFGPNNDVFVLGAKRDFGDKLTLNYSALIGNFLGGPETTSFAADYYHELNIAYQVSDKLAVDVTHVELSSVMPVEIWRQSAHYTINEQMTLGQRYESITGGLYSVESVSVGLNYRREGWDNIVLRPEIRWSEGNGGQVAGGRTQETTFFMDVVITY